MAFYNTQYRLKDGSRYLIHAVSPERSYSEDCSISYDGMQQFYADNYDPALIGRIGCWHSMTSGAGNIYNRQVYHIDPYLADLLRTLWPENGNFGIQQKSAGQPWQITAPYASWEAGLEPAPWSLHGVVCRNHAEWQRHNLPQVFNWLNPGWLSTFSATPTGNRPYVTLQAPHGRWGAFMGGEDQQLDHRGEMEFFAPITLPKMGLGHLVEGFFETCRLWRRMGCFMNYQTASPDTSLETDRLVAESLNYMFDMIADNRLTYHSDACVLYGPDSETYALMARLHSAGVGVMKESAVAPDDPREFHDFWLDSDQRRFPYQVLHRGNNGGGFYDQFIDQKAWAISQGYEQWGSSEFFDVYGEDQWWKVMISGTELGVSYPSVSWSTYGGADQAAKRATMFDAFEAYLDVLKTAVQEVISVVPNSIALLSYQDIRLCGVLTQGYSDTAPRAGYTRADFEALEET